VSLNNVTGAEMATRLLLSQGHQRIGYIGSNHGIEDDLQRQQGYLTAMTQGTSVSMTQTRQPPPESWRAQGSPDLQGGEAAMVELLGRNLQLSAVFAYNDSMAAGALAVLKENGISVPQDFSLVGFDDIPIARYTSPKLTTVRYPIVSMATLATELALKGAANQLETGVSHCFMPTLVRRHSVAPWQNVAPVTY
jgi:LacI family transcriptional regulator